MQEINHSLHQYKGAPGEAVTITITAHDTTHMVNFVLDGAPSEELPEGTPLRFNLKNSKGDETRLELLLGFNAFGSYDIVVSNVDCPFSPPTTCTHKRSGPNEVAESHQYFVNGPTH